jgi:hypothetical protein
MKEIHTGSILMPFKLYKSFDSGGRIEIIDGYAPKSDHNDLVSIARNFAISGKVVQIPTPIHHRDAAYKQVFGTLIGTRYERKCPDLIIDGKFYEYESFSPPFKKRKVSNMISHGAEQAERIIINNNKGCCDRYIMANIHNRLKNKKFTHNIDEVWTYEKGKLRLLFKKMRGCKPLVFSQAVWINPPAGARAVAQLNIFRYLEQR